jgi:predicted N-formylglutamate amidohydrolase
LSRRFDAIIVTCEHGGNGVPLPYRSLFRGARDVLETHRGYDLGALVVAKGLAKRLGAPLHFSTTSRLLVDLNRSLHVEAVWSRWSKELPPAEKARIVARWYAPYREAVQAELARRIGAGERVLHLSVHSFTPKLNGEVRNAEIGVLYDPNRTYEKGLALGLVAALKDEGGGVRVRRNYPYVGYSDGFTTYLRRCFRVSRYAGIELETRQDEIATPAGQKRYIELYAAALARL